MKRNQSYFTTKLRHNLLLLSQIYLLSFSFINYLNVQALLSPTNNLRSSFHTNTNRFNLPSQSYKTKNNNIQMSVSTTKAAATKLLNQVGKLKPSATAFFLCDIQERFRPLMYNSETIITTSQYLTSVANTLSIPIIATQQYTKVFGPTVADCFVNGQQGIDELTQEQDDQMTKLTIFDKKKFSMMTEEVTNYYATNPFMKDRDSVVLFGIEAHVCVQQTCLDLLEMGKDVHVVVDCVSSQQGYDREIALRRMENAGAFLTTAQSLAFMLMESKFIVFFVFCVYFILLLV